MNFLYVFSQFVIVWHWLSRTIKVSVKKYQVHRIKHHDRCYACAFLYACTQFTESLCRVRRSNENGNYFSIYCPSFGEIPILDGFRRSWVPKMPSGITKGWNELRKCYKVFKIIAEIVAFCNSLSLSLSLLLRVFNCQERTDPRHRCGPYGQVTILTHYLNYYTLTLIGNKLFRFYLICFWNGWYKEYNHYWLSFLYNKTL